ncbi:MAG: hypothetical protein V4546_11220 [Bacteroidota bacterium]
MRKIYITLVVLLLTMVGMAYLYFSNLNKETNTNNLSLNAASFNATIVFGFENNKSFYDILNGQDLFEHVLGEEKSTDFKNLKELLLANEIDASMANQKVYISILPGLNNKVDYLISTQVKEDTDVNKLMNGFGKSVKIDKINNLFKLSFADTTSVFVGIKDQLILIANVEKPINDVLKLALIENSTFANYISKNSQYNKNVFASLYLNFNNSPKLLKNILNSNLIGELSVFNKQKTFAALSYNFSTEKLLFNGSTEIIDEKSYYNLFAKMPEQKITINSILPDKTANYVFYSFTNYASWYKGLNNWFNLKGESEKIRSALNLIKDKYRVDLPKSLPQYFTNQLVTFELNSGEKFGAIALNNGEKLNQLLIDLSAEYATDIRIFKDPNIPYYFFGEPFKKFERPFYTIIDNYLIMANNASSIQSFLNSYSKNELLVNAEHYIKFRDQISSSATICFYVNSKNSSDIFGRNLKSPYYKQFQSTKGLKDFDAFCYQLSGDNGKFLSNLVLDKKVDKKDALDTLNINP